MEFKEAYRKGLKTGKTITNGEYNLDIRIEENFSFKNLVIRTTYINGSDKKFIFDINRLFFDSLEDNWEIIMEQNNE